MPFQSLHSHCVWEMAQISTANISKTRQLVSVTRNVLRFMMLSVFSSCLLWCVHWYHSSSWNHTFCVYPSVFSQVAVFMYYGFQLDRLVLQVSSPSFLKSPLPYHPQLRAQAWRYLSYIFMHTGWVYIPLFPSFTSLKKCLNDTFYMTWTLTGECVWHCVK